MELILATLTEQRHLRIEVVGSLSLIAADQLKVQFTHLAQKGLLSVEIDLARTEVIQSVGLSALAVVWERASEAKVPIRFSNVSKDIVRLFEVTGLRSIFLPDEARARASS